MDHLSMHAETVGAQGHLIDSGDLQAILTTIVEHGASYEILELDVGRTNDEPSRLTLRLRADTADSLAHLLEKLSPYGCYVDGAPDAVAAARRHGRRRAGGLLLHDQSPHRGASRRAVGARGRSSAWTPRSSSRTAARTCRKLRDIREGRPGRVRHAGRARACPTCSRATSRRSAS